MKKRSSISRIFFIALLSIVMQNMHAQTPVMDSLRKVVASHPQRDTVRVNNLLKLGQEARKSTSPDSYKAFTEALEIAQEIKYKFGEGMALLGFGFHYRFAGDMQPALSYTQKALEIFIGLKDTLTEINCYYNLSSIYFRTANFELAIQYALDGLRLADILENDKWNVLMNYQLGNLFLALNEVSRSHSYYVKSMQRAEKTNDLEGISHALDGIGRVHEERKNWDSALICYQKTKEIVALLNDPRGVLQEDLGIAAMNEKMGRYDSTFRIVRTTIPKLIKFGQMGYMHFANSILAHAHLHTGNADSALYYAFQALNSSQSTGRIFNSGQMSKLISEAYAKKGNYAEAYRYQQLSVQYMDSVNLNNAIKMSAALHYSFELEKQQSQISLLTKNEELRARESRQQKILLYGTVIGLILLIVFSVILWKNNRAKQKAYTRLMEQQAELKATQSQLIQSEKMASLGELTAGIAHEIQNPLNFVNNFSEVSNELIEELKTEKSKAKDERDEKLENELLNDIAANLEKITFHGKRAGSIVKGMLQHSRGSSGQKEPVDINNLADECLRLSFHGMRAKDKSFNAKIETNFDTSIPAISIVSQEIGRVLLNLFTNSFYSVLQKRNKMSDDYEPVVSVTTSETKAGITIRVRDNGMGIPQKVLDKIYQPFFTTKPTGEGTGLGLSMSYDIITKGHGGQLKVETKEGEYAEFIISLPYKA